MARREEEGAAAVEFALVLPLLLAVVLGIVNFGFVFGQTLALNSAAREAARQAAVPGQTCASAKTVGTTSATALGMAATTVTATVTPCPTGEVCAGTVPGETVRVSLRHEDAWPVPFLVPGVPATYTITGHGEFRCEYS